MIIIISDISMKGIKKHKGCTRCNDSGEDQLVFPFFYIDPRDERVDPWKCVR